MSLIGYLGDEWAQYSNVGGQVYYVDMATGERLYRIPTGWEDHPQDTWNPSAHHNYWVNARTGRIVLEDPNAAPPVEQTYLDDISTIAHLRSVERTPSLGESHYRRVTSAILRWLFTKQEGYDVVQEDDRGTSIPDHVVFKISRRGPGTSFYVYDFLMVECKSPAVSWEAAYDHCIRHCENTDNESGEVYGMVQVGLNVQFYQWGNTTMTTLSDILHLRNDVQAVMAWVDWMKNNPLPFVNS